mmetsp:Transcript_2711/g.6908  ORF Transcript_2711/g.6908 Transcript_2711/m.6908 type:complete len:433 (-) Transcript_2711:70-1368(-)
MARILCALALVPLAAAFAPVPLAGGMGASTAFSRSSLGLRAGGVIPPPRARGGSCAGLRMSDLGDMTLEMLNRLSQRGLEDLSRNDLGKLKNLCLEVSAQIDSLSNKKAAAPSGAKAAPAADVPSTKPFVIGGGNQGPSEEESDAYFGIGEDGPLGEDGVPIGSPASQRQEMPHPDTKPPPARVEVKDYGPTEGTNRFSKYLPDERPEAVAARKKVQPPTDEAVVDKSQWEKEYEQVFGRQSDDKPLTDVDELNAPRNGPVDPTDHYAVVRKVQASAGDYATSEEYYEALNGAIAQWKQARMKDGHKIGAESSNKYIEQLANFSPTAGNRQEFGQKAKFTLDCLLNPAEAQDENGDKVTLLQFTQVDEHGAAGYAGIQVGEALVSMNGTPIFNFDDLKAVLKGIHERDEIVANCVIAGPSGNRDVQVVGATK